MKQTNGNALWSSRLGNNTGKSVPIFPSFQITLWKKIIPPLIIMICCLMFAIRFFFFLFRTLFVEVEKKSPTCESRTRSKKNTYKLKQEAHRTRQEKRKYYNEIKNLNNQMKTVSSRVEHIFQPFTRHFEDGLSLRGVKPQHMKFVRINV